MGRWNEISSVEWQFADDSVSEAYVEKIGEDLGFKFPIAYISCVAINNGANAEPNIFNVDNREKVFGTLLSFDKKNDEFIVDVYKNYKKTLPNKIMPFAFDPAGNLICFDYKNYEDNPIVVFWEHENAAEKEMLIKEGLTQEQAEERARENVYYVAATFTEFLERLHD